MMKAPTDIATFLEKEIAGLKQRATLTNVGEIQEIGDGVAVIDGLSEVAYGEILEFPQKTYGLALNLKSDNVGAIILGDFTHIKAGDTVKSTGQILNIGVSEKLLGRVVNPLGQPLDGGNEIKADKRMALDRIAPGIIKREGVNQPVQTGIKAIDAMIPVGRGQRELIIGDRGTGKSSIALTTILNQKGQNLICIYVAIGQKESFVAQLKSTLEKYGAMDYTIIVDASASTSPALQYLAPLAGCAIGEYFAEKGQDALVIYDDLTKHAWAYREISLLLRRPTGREAYPGDIFYLHSALLERACKYNQKNGGGSLTALPIIETQLGDVSAYIPTNVISITDGQIYLETDLFNAGQKPAINVGASVSRVGSAAQIKAVRQVAGQLRLDLAQFRELAAFAQFASDLDEATKRQIDRGKRVMEMLKQGWDNPLTAEQETIAFWAVGHGYLDKVKVEDIKAYEKGLLDQVASQHKTIYSQIIKDKKLDEKLEAKIKNVVEKYTNHFISKYEAEED
ncbi:F0F1 ATP synthase subunit alpha [Candidatus Beckwithbacteria bacterium]|nr:F0F1 ATP synthase subunit alpha [Candidatus Beckwithbacteria bacterium]